MDALERALKAMVATGVENSAKIKALEALVAQHEHSINVLVGAVNAQLRRITLLERNSVTRTGKYV